MSINPQDRGVYPRSGNVAVLCEGDLSGYEASLLKKWADKEVKNAPLVDVWPCGTLEAIYGLSDAIGRTRPVLMIEDRDFRTPEEAQEDCKKSLRDREARSVRVLDWRTWRRNEIENYLIEPQVLLPVAAEAFGCGEENAKAALQEVIAALPVFQSVRHALHRCRRPWRVTDPPHHLLSADLRCRPAWDTATGRLSVPDSDSTGAILEQNCGKWCAMLAPGESAGSLPTPNEMRVVFNSKCEEWQGVTMASDTWRTDWCGKEVLQYTVVVLAGRFGWLNEKVTWDKLNSDRRAETNRIIESALKSRLESSFLAHLSKQHMPEVYGEWMEILQKLQAYKSPMAP